MTSRSPLHEFVDFNFEQRGQPGKASDPRLCLPGLPVANGGRRHAHLARNVNDPEPEFFSSPPNEPRQRRVTCYGGHIRTLEVR